MSESTVKNPAAADDTIMEKADGAPSTRAIGAGPSMFSHVAFEVTRADATNLDRAYWFGIAMMVAMLQVVLIDCMNYSQQHQKCTTDDDCPYKGHKGVQICAWPFEPTCYPCSAKSKFDGHGAGADVVIEGRGLGDYREVLDDANFTRQRLLWQDGNFPGVGRWATCWRDPTFASCANTSEVNPFRRCAAREAQYVEYEKNAMHVNPATRKTVRLDIFVFALTGLGVVGSIAKELWQIRLDCIAIARRMEENDVPMWVGALLDFLNIIIREMIVTGPVAGFTAELMAGSLEADDILMNGLAMIFVLEIDDLLYAGYFGPDQGAMPHALQAMRSEVEKSTYQFLSRYCRCVMCIYMAWFLAVVLLLNGAALSFVFALSPQVLSVLTELHAFASLCSGQHVLHPRGNWNSNQQPAVAMGLPHFRLPVWLSSS